MKFEKAIELILEYEGGYVNHPQDPGGETNFGISKRAFPLVDIKNLTRAQAMELYKRFYWDACHCSELPSKLRLMVLDGAINQGVPATIGLLQVAVGAKVDGVMGEDTIKKAYSFPETLIVEKLAALRCARYFDNPKFKFFGAGWMSRLLKVSVRTMGEE